MQPADKNDVTSEASSPRCKASHISNGSLKNEEEKPYGQRFYTVGVMNFSRLACCLD
jgi:hypothetical protein